MILSSIRTNGISELRNLLLRSPFGRPTPVWGPHAQVSYIKCVHFGLAWAGGALCRTNCSIHRSVVGAHVLLFYRIDDLAFIPCALCASGPPENEKLAIARFGSPQLTIARFLDLGWGPPWRILASHKLSRLGHIQYGFDLKIGP